MTDINQWRRMIQPARVRTPAVEPEDATLLSPTTPRRGLKPKLSSYLTQHATLSGPSKTDLLSDEDMFNQNRCYPLWSSDDPAPNPDAERLMETVMCKLLTEPYRALDPRFNNLLMQIFESYRCLKDDKERLQLEIEQEIEKRDALERALHHASQQWETEKQDYKAEVKRLELILAKGKQGLAEVTLARQNSVIRRGKHQSMGNDETMEMIFEFLEKSKREWGSQRATMRRRSLSAQMRRLSKTLTKKSSMTNVHVDLPFGRPPLAKFSFLNDEDNSRCHEAALHHESEVKSHISDDTLSTFSCAGDLLPDEAANVNLIQAAGTDNEFVAVKRIANVLAKRRQVDPDAVMPKLEALFDVQSSTDERSISLPTSLGRQSIVPASTQSSQPGENLRKNPTLRVKASGFLARMRPQLNVDTSVGLDRRFSFEAGDDANASLSAPVIDALPPTVRERLIRKSASMSSLEVAWSKTTAQERLLSPVAQSPTTSAVPQEFAGTPPDQEEAKKTTRIPTPVYSSGSLARPRRDRDDSASSLLTAIKVSRPVSQRSSSISSSSHSSPSASRVDLSKGLYGSQTIQGSGQNSNRLLHHTNTLRGGVAAVAAQKAVGINLNNIDQHSAPTHGQQKVISSNYNRSSTRSGTDSDMGELRKENEEPMRRSMSSNTPGNTSPFTPARSC